MRRILTDPMMAFLIPPLVITVLLVFATPFVAPRVHREEPVRLCPVDDEVMQWPCKHIPWEGRA